MFVGMSEVASLRDRRHKSWDMSHEWETRDSCPMTDAHSAAKCYADKYHIPLCRPHQ